MTEEEKLKLKEKIPSDHDNSPQTLENATLQETNLFSKEENKTISSTNKKEKKNKKPPKLKIESRNNTNGFQKDYKKISRTESHW
jgi:hypothetical protein